MPPRPSTLLNADSRIAAIFFSEMNVTKMHLDAMFAPPKPSVAN